MFAAANAQSPVTILAPTAGFVLFGARGLCQRISRRHCKKHTHHHQAHVEVQVNFCVRLFITKAVHGGALHGMRQMRATLCACQLTAAVAAAVAAAICVRLVSRTFCSPEAGRFVYVCR